LCRKYIEAEDLSSPYQGIHIYWQGWIVKVSSALDLDAEIWDSIELGISFARLVRGQMYTDSRFTERGHSPRALWVSNRNTEQRRLC
jgi:hypothetical protein